MPAPANPAADPVPTPEHLQLLSNARLRALTETTATATPTTPQDRAWQRLAQVELRHRSGRTLPSRTPA